MSEEGVTPEILVVGSTGTCSCQKSHPRRSRSMLVLAEDAAEAIMSSYIEVGNLVGIHDLRG